MRISEWLAEIKRGSPREAVFEVVRAVIPSVWTWVGGPTVLTLILQQWSAYSWDVKFVALLLAATGGLVAWRHLYGWSSTSVVDGGRVGAPDVSARLATVSWQHGLKDHSIDHPWQLHAIVEYSQYARDVSCYIRWGRLVHYMDGGSAFECSKQTTLRARPEIC